MSEDDGNPKTFEIQLAGFEFPQQIDNSKANFRFIVDLRYVDVTDEFATEHAVMPSLDTFWECDTGKTQAPNFVRAGQNGAWDAKFDMEKIDDWDRLVLRVKGRQLHSVQVKVIDVDRADVFDKLKGALQGVLEGALGTLRARVAARIPGSTGSQDMPPSVHQAFGSAVDNVEAFLLKKLAGADDVLFRGSGLAAGDSVCIRGAGTRGDYQIDLSVKDPFAPRETEPHSAE